MGFIDTLRKLGILRFGGKAATYTNASDRPAEFVHDGVFDADKEMTTIDLSEKEEPTNDSGTK